MLIPKQWEHKHAFMLEAMKAFATASMVFRNFDCEPGRSDVLDYSAFVDTMQNVCQRHRRDSSGVEDLRFTISIFDACHQADREQKKLDDEEFKRGLASAQRLRWWLHQTLPDAGPHSERN